VEQTTTLPAGGLGAEHFDDVLADGHRVLTVRIALGPDQPQAVERARLAWADLAARATEADVPDALVDRAAEAVAERARSSRRIVVTATEVGGLAVDDDVDDRAPDDLRWSWLPWFRPLVASRQAPVDHAVVLCDRTGADVTIVRGRHTRTVTIEGETDFITKVHAGGWSEPRFQRKAERTWRTNAADVAEAITHLLRSGVVEVALVGGDERACGLVLGDLHDDARDQVRSIGATRAPGSSEELEAEAIRTALADVRARETTAWLELLHAREGQREATTEPAGVFDALRRSQVAALLLGDGPGEASFVAGRPDTATLDEGNLVGGGDEPRSRAPAVDVATWAALRTGACVLAVPVAALGSPLGAVLRWAS
jgi:hypothetical protein